MIGLDTNVLLRYIMQDDVMQSAQAESVINTLSRTEQGFVSLVVVAELGWVLSYSFQLRRVDLHTVLVRLVNMPELKVENVRLFLQALRLFKTSSADLADCLIIGIAKNAGCSRTATFDRKAARLPGAFYIG